MKTVICQEPCRMALADTPEPRPPGPGRALVRVHRCGVCGTDLHAYEGRQPFFEYPRILGHELGVEVEAVGDGVTGVAPGACCAVEPYLECGTCSACRRGFTNCCENLALLGVHVDGGMRERLLVPADKLHPSATLSLDQLALVETLAIGCHAVGRAQVRAGENVLVVGAGPIGLSVLLFAQAAGARVVLLEASAERRRFAAEHLGVARVMGPDADPVPRLRDPLDGGNPRIVVYKLNCVYSPYKPEYRELWSTAVQLSERLAEKAAAGMDQNERGDFIVESGAEHFRALVAEKPVSEMDPDELTMFIADAADCARHVGWAYLSRVVDLVDEELLATGLRMVGDDADPHIMMDALEARYHEIVRAGDLRLRLIADAIAAIQQGKDVPGLEAVLDQTQARMEAELDG